MGKKDRKINKKKQQQHQQGKGGKKKTEPVASGSCRHRAQASVANCAKVREDKECVVSGCTELDDLRVCLGCGLVACKVHAKRHWAKAQSTGHSLVYLVDAKDESVQVYCYDCDRFSTELEGDLARAVELIRSGGAEEEEDGESGGRGQQVQVSAKSKPGNGLTNLGNTCFMNSVLQCLAYLPPLVAGDVVAAGPLGSALLTTLAAIWTDNAKKRFSPSDLLKLVRGTFAQFRRGTQEDAHELFRSLLDAVDEEFNRKKLQAQSLVRRVFMLETTSVVTCHGCTATFARREDAMDCSVQMVSASSKKNKRKKQQQQQENEDAAAEAEEDESDETAAGGAEEDDGAAEADVISIVMPVFLGKRFPIFITEMLPVFLEQAPPPPPPPKTLQSVAAPVVPTRLDEASGRYDARPAGEGKRTCAFLEAFTSPELLAGRDRYRCSKCQARRRASKQLLLGPKLPPVLAVHFKRFGQDASGQLYKIARAVEGLAAEIDVSAYCVAPPEAGASYRLRGLVVHSGTSLRQGHYIAYCTYGAEGKWVMISDTNVRPCSLAEALSSEAYIAFYAQQ